MWTSPGNTVAEHERGKSIQSNLRAVWGDGPCWTLPFLAGIRLEFCAGAWKRRYNNAGFPYQCLNVRTTFVFIA